MTLIAKALQRFGKFIVIIRSRQCFSVIVNIVYAHREVCCVFCSCTWTIPDARIMPDTDISSFLEYGSNGSSSPTVIIVGDGRSRVRKVVQTTTRHVTVVNYSSRHKESSTHTSHHVTTVR